MIFVFDALFDGPNSFHVSLVEPCVLCDTRAIFQNVQVVISVAAAYNLQNKLKINLHELFFV